MKNNLELLVNAILNINEYDLELGSLNKKVEEFDTNIGFKNVYSKVLKYISRKSIDKELLDLIKVLDIDIACRIKTEESIRKKWNKNIGAKRALNKVFNDLIGVRIITDINIEEMLKHIDEITKKVNKTIKIVNFNEKPKSPDDGYRGLHIYIKNNPKCFQSEIQIWSKIDAILNFYTHQNIYKQNLKTEYPLNLRAWMDKIPNSKKANIKFEDYLYNLITDVNTYNESLAELIVELCENDKFSDASLLVSHYKYVTNEDDEEYISKIYSWIENIPEKDEEISFSFIEYIYKLNLEEVV